MSYSFPIRIWVIVVALFTALVFVVFILKPLVFEPMCLLKSNSCLEIEYWTLQNSVIAHAIPTGYWIWFNGFNVYVFGEPTGRVCPNQNFEPTYVVDLQSNELLGYECVMPLQDILTTYQKQGSEKRYIFTHIPKEEWNTFNVYDMINVLTDNNVISIIK